MKRKRKSSLSMFAIGTVAILVIGIAAVMFLIFKTNSLYAYDDETIENIVFIPSQASSLAVSATTQSVENGTASGPITLSGEWYTDMSSIKADRSQTVQIGSLTAYKGYPWDATGETFFYDIQKAKTDLWNYLTGIGAPKPLGSATLESTLKNFWTVDSYSEIPFINAGIATVPKAGTTSTGTKYASIDGVQCYYFAPMPCQFDKEFYSSGEWSRSSCAKADYTKVKFAVVLTERSNEITDQSKWIYLPCVTGDVKAHTYPWGVAQTNVRVKDNTAVDIAYRNGGEQNFRKTVGDIGTDNAVKEIANDSHFNSYYGNMLDGLYCVFETCGIQSVDCDKFKNKYTCVGCITYKE